MASNTKVTKQKRALKEEKLKKKRSRKTRLKLQKLKKEGKSALDLG